MANLSSSQFSNLSGPSDAELRGIEAGSPESESYGSFTSEQVEGLRKMNERIDPNYARTRSARRGGGGTLSGITPHMQTGTGSESAGFSITDAMSSQNRSESTQYGVDTHVDMGSSGDDPASSRRSVSGSGTGSLGGQPSRYYETHKQKPDYQTGVFLLRTAGRCNHARCEMIRDKGMELVGADTRYQTGKTPWEAKQPEIPSTYEDKPTYPIRGGKEDRSNPQIIRMYSVADKNHPEWQKLIKEGKSGNSIYQPEDFLQHHHSEDEGNFEKYPLPWNS